MIPSPVIIAALAALNFLVGTLAGLWWGSLLIQRAVRRAKDETWRIIERQRFEELREKSRQLGLCPESLAGPVREQAPPLPASLAS